MFWIITTVVLWLSMGFAVNALVEETHGSHSVPEKLFTIFVGPGLFVVGFYLAALRDILRKIVR